MIESLVNFVKDRKPMKGFKYGNKITRFVFPRGLINHPLNYPTDLYYFTAYVEYSSSFIRRSLFYISDELGSIPY